ncbi:MAG: YggS family pyridoxal phosphate-dependent enzyme [Blastocatellia bacterium]|nr:YggS family pyridoxal phosphate-dependent enzyme [Blastocatellia bacterium]MCS7157609.1 YggS family pyridoxal phosphate-dependent enzyme [Blastocatellia bacterium]MCX7751874.1 YggS family pyridoxal phosphate-dependent enzyme [Blastocatellia bacterium]MDW8166980.1 YggS family pyridoxal phosphate-dependent enzyme [Acidobacteriota bacterium]MDW8257084.1 YggS family pyridoxal phosphate-dependent enzyme [Acidobacteriota bacterium]
MSEEIAERVALVRERIRRAAERAGRSSEEITLVAVTKGVEVERIRAAIAAGLTHFGENRVQEAERKITEIHAPIVWHLVGHLQSNKARRAVQLFHAIHSLDSLRLAERLDRIAGELGRTIPVLLQVDLAGEPTKFGIPVDQLIEVARGCRPLRHLSVRGLMAIPPYFEDPERVRPYFRRLAECLRELNAREIFEPPLRDLSMGMSHDFEVAIEEGATMVRIGRAIFGERQP